MNQEGPYKADHLPYMNSERMIMGTSPGKSYWLGKEGKRNFLFVCAMNKYRSRTAETIYKGNKNIEVKSAGTSKDCNNPVTEDLIQWADIIFVMERKHGRILYKRFPMAVDRKLMVCLNIFDCYDYMEPALIKVLKNKVTKCYQTYFL